MTTKSLYHLLIIGCTALLLSCSDDDQLSTTAISINGGAEFLSLNHQAHTGTLSIKSSQPWELSSDAEWLGFSVTNGKMGTTNITMEMAQNNSAARFTTLKFATDTQTFDFVVSQSAANSDFDSPTHYFYITFGTMPTLYAGLFLLAYDKPSYFFFERTDTFNPNLFPSYVTSAPYYTTDQAKMRDYMKAQIRNINRDNPTAVFGLMVDDLRARIGYDWFVGQGIDSSRVKVTLLSDGTATYNEFYNQFGNNVTAETKWKQIASTIDQLDWNHDGRYPSTRVLPELESWGWEYYLSTQPNYRLLLQNSSLLETNSQFIKEQVTKMDMLNITPYELLEQLTSSDKFRFYEMANFDYNTFAGMFDASTKPNLIIIGTNGMDSQQKVYTQKIYDQYSATHDLFFKPHPADLSSANYETLFPGLKLLPGRMPFEIFIWSLLDKIEMIGGFPSTVFLSTPIDKVGFIFAPNAQSMYRPLNLLFQDATNVEWIQ